MGVRNTTTCAGFTLVEMAVVMVVMGLVMLTVFPALTALRTANQQSLTQSNLRNLMLATATYVQANGCLPCPAIPGNAGSGAAFGKLGLSVSTAACGTCAAPEGIVPFASLGIPAATAHDGWGHWITMRVDPALTSLPTNPSNCANANTCSAFAPPALPCVANDVTNGFCTSAQINTSAKGLCAAGLSSKTSKAINVITPGGATQQVAVIFVSHGADGYGSYIAQPKAKIGNGSRLQFPSNYTTCSSSGGYALCNANNTETTAATYYDAPKLIANTNPYDDVLAYADRNSLVSMLGNGSCQTVW